MSHRRLIDRCVRRARELLRAHPVRGTSKKYHFSFLVRSGKIVATGLSRPPAKHDPRTRHYPVYALRHAESDMLSKRLANSASLVVSVRLNSAGHLRCSKPCACCQAALRAAGVRRVVFHDGNDWGVCKL